MMAIDSRNRDDLAHLARNGAGLIVDGAKYSSEDLAHIARNLKDGSVLQICNSGRFTTEQLAQIARNGSGKVRFE
jgi:hypothetical protein